jgi:hypothetical protein
MIDQMVRGNSVEIIKSFQDGFVHTIISDVSLSIKADIWLTFQ